MNLDALGSDMQPFLPEGYSSTGTLSPALAAVQVTAEECDAIVINNETILPETALLVVLARVSVDEALGEGADFQAYALEILATDQTLVNLLRAVGFEAHLASIDIVEADSIEVRVTVEGTLWYEVTAVPWTFADAPEDSLDYRRHQVGPRGPVWFDHEYVYTLPSEPGPSVLRAHAGSLRELAPADQDVLQATTWLGVSRGELAFGHA